MASADLAGGVRVIAIYAKALARMGHVVRVVSPPAAISFRGKFKSWLAGKGWPNYPLPSASHIDDEEIDHHLLDRWRPVTNDDVPDADIVIATWWETAEWVYRLAPQKGAKVYFVQHHEVFSYLPVERCRATYLLPLHKIAVAQWLRNVMSAEYGDNVVDLVPNSVDHAQFFAPIRDQQGVPTVGFMYSPAEFKGVDVVFEALKLLRKRFPNLRVLAFGSHSPTQNLPLPAGVEFFRSPAQHQIRELYAQCDVWITASRSEGFNLPAMEAMACRAPVVATRTGWPEEAVKSGINGVLVEIDDPDGIAEGTQWVLTRNAVQWRELSDNAYATATAGSWQESAKMFEEALMHACERSARGEIAGGYVTQCANNVPATEANGTIRVSR
jgi:glycosyltransferase involved in cell wall biosynthesis